MEEKKLRGFAAMTPEQRKAAIEKGHATRAANKLKRESRQGTSTGKEDIKQAVLDPEKTHQTLDRMRYTKDAREAAIWGANPDLSPLHVPQEIQDKYPEFAFKWCSTKKIDKRGGTGPWEILKDRQFSKDGIVRRADDTVLAVMPKELKEETIDKPKAERATAALLGLEQARLEEMEKRAAEARADGDQHASVMYNEPVTPGGRIGGTGIQIGRHNIRRRSEKLREQFIARSAQNKKYFFLGNK